MRSTEVCRLTIQLVLNLVGVGIATGIVTMIVG